MTRELEAAAQRFAVFANQVILPAVYPRSVRLNVTAWQCPDPVPYAEAMRGAYRPVDMGWRWGPVWSTAWFHLTGRVPVEMRDRPVVLRFSCGTEALLWRGGEPWHGLDVNHDVAPLLDSAQGGEEVDLYVEAACNHPFGVTAFWWVDPEVSRRWTEERPGRLEQCDLALLDRTMWQLSRAFEFARQLMLLMPEGSARGRQLCDALQRATERLTAGAASEGTAAALSMLNAALRAGAAPSATVCYSVGQAHIDTAWLWRLRETRRKCQRTAATALRLMEAYPDFHFLLSQAQQYAWIEESSPELFRQVKARVAEGRWEAAGAMWVEADCNVPSGESLVRQIQQGTRYWETRFGDRGRQRVLYLPDTFGFCPALPQLMALAGLDTFVTNKLWWNDTNEFPYVSFRWRGLDGTEVLAHLTPGRDYNAVLSPAELQRGEQMVARKEGVGGAGIWLQPFGYGDGGGGATAGMLEDVRLAECCEGLPRIVPVGVTGFCDELHRRWEALRKQGRDLPVWDGELYLEYHRGTYTTQGWIKRANRRAENGLRMAEWLAYAGPTPAEAGRIAGIRKELDTCWKTLLLNQFHDILPGSSISEVYDDARQQHDSIRESYEALIAEGMRRWAAAVDTADMQDPMVVFNPPSTVRSGVVECEGRRSFVRDVPALGMAVVDRAAAPEVDAVRVQGRTLSNGLIEATIDEAGRVSAFHAAGGGRDACRLTADGAREPLNRLVLYDDRPRGWDAWDLDAEYELHAEAVCGAAEDWRVVEAGPWRGVIQVTRPLGRASRITQEFVLEAGGRRLDIRSRVEWHEERRLLRALFPVDVRARRATYETQFGHIERPTHRSSSRERAMFEVCAHRWMDLSEPGFGVALLNDCKYGHSCHDGVMGLSLLRSPKFPDPLADMGSHEFTYSLMVHGGDWRSAGVDREAEALNAPLVAQAVRPGQRGRLGDRWAPFALRAGGAAGVSVSAVTEAVGDGRLLVRLVETHGGRGGLDVLWNVPVTAVEAVDLLDRPRAWAGLVHHSDAGRTWVPIGPFQIVTLAAGVRQHGH